MPVHPRDTQNLISDILACRQVIERTAVVTRHFYSIAIPTWTVSDVLIRHITRPKVEMTRRSGDWKDVLCF